MLFLKFFSGMARGLQSLETPVPVKTLKSSNIGPEQYLDWKPVRKSWFCWHGLGNRGCLEVIKLCQAVGFKASVSNSKNTISASGKQKSHYAANNRRIVSLLSFSDREMVRMEALIEKGNHPRRKNVGQSNNPEKNDFHLLLKGFSWASYWAALRIIRSLFDSF